MVVSAAGLCRVDQLPLNLLRNTGNFAADEHGFTRKKTGPMAAVVKVSRGQQGGLGLGRFVESAIANHDLALLDVAPKPTGFPSVPSPQPSPQRGEGVFTESLRFSIQLRRVLLRPGGEKVPDRADEGAQLMKQNTGACVLCKALVLLPNLSDSLRSHWLASNQCHPCSFLPSRRSCFLNLGGRGSCRAVNAPHPGWRPTLSPEGRGL